MECSSSASQYLVCIMRYHPLHWMSIRKIFVDQYISSKISRFIKFNTKKCNNGESNKMKSKREMLEEMLKYENETSQSETLLSQNVNRTVRFTLWLLYTNNNDLVFDTFIGQRSNYVDFSSGPINSNTANRRD